MNNDLSFKLHKIYTEAFWETHMGQRKGRKGQSRKSVLDTLAAIRHLGTIKLDWGGSAKSPIQNRQQFDKLKNKQGRFRKFKVCFACGAQAECRHHLIWVKNGGRNTKKNIVALCNDCHAEIHPWLKFKEDK